MATGGQGSVYTSTKERTNYARLCRAIIDLGTQVLRDILHRQIQPGQIKHKALSCGSLKLKPFQLSKINTAIGQGYGQFDISLLYNLIIKLCPNISPTNGWYHRCPPSSTETTEGDDVERIHFIRNNIYGHLPNTCISDTLFCQYWEILKSALTRLDTSLATQYSLQLSHLETMCMDETTETTYVNKMNEMEQSDRELRREVEKMSERVQTLSTTGISVQQEMSVLKSDMLEHLQTLNTTGISVQQEMSVLKSEMLELFGKMWSTMEVINLKDQTKRAKLIGESSRLINRYLNETDIVKINAYDVIIQTLLQKGWAVITGLPGIGKTTLGCLVMNDIVNGKITGVTGKQPLVISKPYEWKNVVCSSDNLFIFIDNIFGTYSLTNVKEWKEVLDDSINVISDIQDQRRNFLLVALRTEVYKECLPVVRNNPIFQAVIDLSIETNMSTVNKLAILDKYTPGHEFTAEEKDHIMKTSNFIGFPQCCSLFKNDTNLQKTGSSFFKKPIYFLDLQLREIWTIEPVKFSALALVMMNGGKIHEREFESSVQINLITAICRIDSSNNFIKKCLHAARLLVGTYLSHDGNSFTFSHDSIHHAVAMVLWNDNWKEVIQNCSINFLANICASGSTVLNQPDPVVAPEHSYPILAQRVIKELNTKQSTSYQSVSEMKVWDESKFCTEISNLTFADHTNGQFNWDEKDDQSHSILYHAVATRNISFVQYLFTKCPSQVNRNIALNITCKMGDLSLFQICRDNDAQIDIETLFSAVKGGNEDIYNRAIAIYLDIYVKNKSKSNVLNVECTILQEICMQRKLSLLKISIDKMGNGYFKNFAHHQELLKFAAVGGSLDIVKYLIKTGVDVFQLDINRTSVLGHACYFGHLDLVQYFASNYECLMLKPGKLNMTPLIFLASGTGSVDVAKCLISKGVDVYSKDDQGITVFHKACGKGHLTLVKYLYDCYPELIQVKGQYNWTPLHCTAAGTGSTDVAEYLISKGVNVNTKDDQGITVLHIACKNGHLTLVKYLYDRYPELIQVKGEYNSTPLHCTAGGTGSTDLAEYLITKGVDAYTRDDQRNTVFHIACHNGHLTLVKYLCDRYPELIQVKGQYNATPLHYTAEGSGSTDVAEYLISKGVNAYTRNDHDNTVFHIACENGHLTLVRYLFDRYPGLIQVKGQYNCTPLHCTARGTGSTDVAEYLISKGVNADAKDDHCYTVFHIACVKGHLTVVKYLYDRYPELIQVKCQYNFTTLHCTAGGTGSTDLAEYLITKGVDAYTRDDQRNTVFHIACHSGHLTLVKYLCDRYPELIQVKGQYNATPLHYTAEGSGSTDVAEYLISKGVNAYTRNDHDNTVFHIACENGHLTLVRYLFDRYPGLIQVKGQYNCTPLHCTARGTGSTDVAEYLISKGVNVHSKDISGFTVLDVARHRGHLSLITFLCHHYPELMF